MNRCSDNFDQLICVEFSAEFVVDVDCDVTDVICLDREPWPPQEMNITLTWGEIPRDLDAHLWTPEIEGESRHIFFGNRGSLDSPPYAWLDRDVVTGFGPEQIIITRFFPGEYTYAVHDWTNQMNPGSTALYESGARVEILTQYRCGEETVEFQVEDVVNPGPGIWWHVFTLDGATGEMTVINELSASPPVGSQFVVQNYPQKGSE